MYISVTMGCGDSQGAHVAVDIYMWWRRGVMGEWQGLVRSLGRWREGGWSVTCLGCSWCIFNGGSGIGTVGKELVVAGVVIASRRMRSIINRIHVLFAVLTACLTTARPWAEWVVVEFITGAEKTYSANLTGADFDSHPTPTPTIQVKVRTGFSGLY